MEIFNILNKIIRKITHPQYKSNDFGALGKNCHISSDSILVPRNIFIGDHCIIQNKVNFISHKGKLIIKKYSVISSGCTIIPSTHLPSVGVPFYYQALEHIGDKDYNIIINEDCWIGANSILLPGCQIGRGAIVGAGAVVTKDVPPYSVVAGCPAIVIASKFSKEEIIEHEKALYQQSEERLSKNEIDLLFTKHFQNKPSLKKD